MPNCSLAPLTSAAGVSCQTGSSSLGAESPGSRGYCASFFVIRETKAPRGTRLQKQEKPANYNFRTLTTVPPSKPHHQCIMWFCVYTKGLANKQNSSHVIKGMWSCEQFAFMWHHRLTTDWKLFHHTLFRPDPPFENNWGRHRQQYMKQDTGHLYTVNLNAQINQKNWFVKN